MIPLLLMMQVILPGPTDGLWEGKIVSTQDLGCNDYFVATTVKLTWNAVEENQIIVVPATFPHDSVKQWTLTHYGLNVTKNGKAVSYIPVTPPTTTYTYKISATSTTGGNYCFNVAATGRYFWLPKPREETWHSAIITEILPMGFHTLTWPPPLGVEYDGFQVRATTDVAYIDEYLLVAGETADKSNPSVTYYVAKPYTVHQKISAVKIVTTAPPPRNPGRMTVTRK